MMVVSMERRIEMEHMFALDPPHEPPEWLSHFSEEQLLVWTMNDAGEVSPGWTWADAIDWHDVVAVRLETRRGGPIDPLDLFEGEWDW